MSPVFFIKRPIFAMVIALLTVIIGFVSMSVLPIEQYPNVTPPTVTTCLPCHSMPRASSKWMRRPRHRAHNPILLRLGWRWSSADSAHWRPCDLTITSSNTHPGITALMRSPSARLAATLSAITPSERRSSPTPPPPYRN